MDDNHYKVDRFEVVSNQERQASEKLQLIEKKCNNSPVAFIRENYSNSRIRKTKSEPHFKMTLAIMLTKISALAGITGEVDDFNASDINKFILTSCNDLSLEEIHKAFELERFGSYDEKTKHFNLFNADYVSTVIKKYRKWKLEVKTQFNISKTTALPEMTESQKREIINQGIIRVFSEYQETKKLPEPNAYIFDELYERKIIKGSDTPKLHEYYQVKIKQAEKELKDEFELSKKTSPGKTERRQIQEEIDKILLGDSEKIFVRTKRIILAEYFDKLIRENIDIQCIISKN